MNIKQARLNNNKIAVNIFSIFSILYMTSFLLEMTESWKHPGFAAVFVILISFFVFTPKKLFKLFIFLVSSTAYILVFRFPEVANHVNFIVFLNIGLILGILYSCWRREAVAEKYWKIMLPFLRIALILVYFFAGFHKLNQDFFNPNLSCAGGFLATGYNSMLGSTVLGVPSILILFGSISFLLYRLWGNPLQAFSRQIQIFILFGLTFCAITVATQITAIQELFPSTLKASIILSLAVMVVAWEMIGGLLLLIPKFQGIILLFSWIMHMSFAPIGFVDFGALAFALLFTFIPPNYIELLEKHPDLQLGQFRIHRVYGYFSIILFMSFLKGIHYKLGIDLGDIKFLSGLLLNAAAIFFMWPILKMLCSRDRLPWLGVPIWTRQTPKFIGILVLVIILFGMTPYVGLRTAGNFSMFSNLKTEGKNSNHLLLEHRFSIQKSGLMYC